MMETDLEPLSIEFQGGKTISFSSSYFGYLLHAHGPGCEVIRLNVHCYHFSVLFSLIVQKSLLLIVGSETRLFNEFQAGLLLRKPSFLGSSVAFGQAIWVMMLYVIFGQIAFGIVSK